MCRVVSHLRQRFQTLSREFVEHINVRSFELNDDRAQAVPRAHFYARSSGASLEALFERRTVRTAAARRYPLDTR